MSPPRVAATVCLALPRCLAASLVAVLLVTPAAGHAQQPDASPAAAGGRFAVGGDLSASFAREDEHYFNYTDYELNQLRLVAGGLGASLRVTPWLTTTAELRFENVDHLWVSALYVRVRPSASAPFYLLVGRVPPVFGAFARQRYGADNPLVSMPLAYQSLTTLRRDAVPANADTLLAVRGRGWNVPYAGGDAPLDYATGLPLVASSRWDTGILASYRSPRLEATLGLTQGSLSHPVVADHNDGKQVVGRLVWRPSAAVAVGLSGAGGEYLDEPAVSGLPRPAQAGGPWLQQAIGADLEASAGHWVARGEVIVTRWRVPVVEPPRIDSPLGAVASTFEVRYRVRPSWYLAARGDHIALSDITGTLYGGVPTAWDAPVSRIEAGGGYLLTRQVRLKLVYQHDWRAGRLRISEGFVAGQLALWF